MVIELGTKVHFDHGSILWREHHRGGVRRWSPVEWNKGYMTGVIVGERWLSNGRVEYGGWDDATQFYPTEHFKAYLVAYDMRRKPVYVRPEDLEEIND